MNRYSRIDTEDESTCAEIDTPVDEGGNTLVSGKELLSVGAFTAEVVFSERTVLRDLIPCLTNELALSTRAAEVVRRFRLQEGAQLIPVKIVMPNGTEVGRCVCVYFPTRVKALDEERTQFRHGRATGVRLSATKPVLDGRLIVGTDLMEVLYVGLVCSELPKDAIEEENLTNFVFEELEVTQ